MLGLGMVWCLCIYIFKDHGMISTVLFCSPLPKHPQSESAGSAMVQHHPFAVLETSVVSLLMSPRDSPS